MKKVFSWLDANFEDAICGVLLLIIMGMLIAQVFVRAVFGHGLTTSEEISRFSFLFLVYFGSSLVASKGAHIRVTAQMKFFPRPIPTLMFLLADLLWLTFNGFVIYYGTMLIISMTKRPMISGGLLIDLKPIYAVLPVAFSLQSFRIIQRWYRFLAGKASLVKDEVSIIEEEAEQTREDVARAMKEAERQQGGRHGS